MLSLIPGRASSMWDWETWTTWDKQNDCDIHQWFVPVADCEWWHFVAKYSSPASGSALL